MTSAGGHSYTYHPDTLLPETAVIPVGLTEHQRKLTFTRDALLRLAGLALGTMASAAPATDYAESYTYDALSRAATLTATSPGLAAETFTTTYHAAKPHLIASVGGTVNTTTFEHEPLRDILTQKRTALTGSDPQTTSALALYTYTVNNIGQRTSASSQLASPAGLPTQDTTINYTYNDKGELETATHGTDPTQNRAYQYDDIGNRTQSGTGVPPVSLTTYTSNNLNQYTGITPPAPAAPVTPTHDADGNTLDNATHTFTYDAENRLKTAHRKSDGALVATYTYDHASRRVRKQTTAAAPQGATDTAYVYHGWTLLAEYQLQNSTLTLQTSYTWGSTGLQRVTTQGTAPAAAYPLIDANKNINGYSDATGTILARYDYDPFGNTTAQSGPQATQFAHRFSSEIHDQETGLLYYGYRYYHPPTGTWLTRDPIGEFGGFNLYGFIGNDGANHWDLWGLYTIDYYEDRIQKNNDQYLINAGILGRGEGNWLHVMQNGLLATQSAQFLGKIEKIKYASRRLNELNCTDQKHYYFDAASMDDERDIALFDLVEQFDTAINAAIMEGLGLGFSVAFEVAITNMARKLRGKPPINLGGVAKEMEFSIAQVLKYRQSGGSNGEEFLRGIETASDYLVNCIGQRFKIKIVTEKSKMYREWKVDGTNAQYVNGIIYILPDVKRIEILEEYLHGVQDGLGILNKTKYKYPGFEVHVKRYMLRHQKMLGISDEDAAILRKMLERYQ